MESNSKYKNLQNIQLLLGAIHAVAHYYYPNRKVMTIKHLSFYRRLQILKKNNMWKTKELLELVENIRLGSVI